MTVGNYLEKLFSLEGKTAMVIGAAGAIASEAAACLSGAGANLALCDLSSQRLELILQRMSKKEKSACFEVDLLDDTSILKCVDQVLDRFGQIDILINCAGINKREGILDVKRETFDRIMGIQFSGVFMLSAEVVRRSMHKTGGKIVNVGSYTSSVAMGGSSVYGAAKCGIVSLTRSMCIEWAKFNIRANCICPGHIRTEMTRPLWDDKNRTEWLLDRIAADRPGTPEDLAGAFLFFSSPASDYISGTMINVDGGSVAGGKSYPFDTDY